MKPEGEAMKKGQTMVEYVLVFAALVGVIGVMTHLIVAARQATDRTERLVASDYP